MREKIVRFSKNLLALEDTPERIARAFALGVFLAFSPLIGLHVFLGIGLALLFGLNRFALLVGIFINNPLTLVPIYAAGTYLGGLLIGFPRMPANADFELRSIGSLHFWGQIAGHWPILKPMVIGSFALSVLLSAFAYFAMLAMIRQRRAHQAKY